MSNRFSKSSLLATTVIAGFAFGAPAFAQDVPGPADGVEQPSPADQADQTPPATEGAQEAQAEAITSDTQSAAEGDAGQEIVVTGSRIVRPNLESNSPVAVVTGEETTENADITLETFLNTLPQVNPAATSTSNNPGNGGQANIDLRGLGSNRNLVLIDGRRPMVSNGAQVVDVNIIPQGLIERIDVMTGGAGAAYGADAIAGVVNIILKDDFEGIDLRATYSNAPKGMDAEEYQILGTFGANFADGRGNMVVSAEYAERDSLIKGERDFARQATSTTPTPPVGRLLESGKNAITQAAIDAVFASYGVSAAQTPNAGASLIAFNSDNTLFGVGRFNSPLDVANFRYDPAGLDAAAANQNYFPDFYSYNFDAVNYLVLPFERRSVFLKGNYEISESADVFIQGQYAEYTANTALAPTPVGVPIKNPDVDDDAATARSSLINLFCPTSANPTTECSATGLVIPVTNPFVPDDLAALLASRTGDNPIFAGAGATEPFNLAYRFLATGLREAVNNNQILQGLIGVRGDITSNWRYEVSASWGRATLDSANTGNINVNLLQSLLEDPYGGAGDEVVAPGEDADTVNDGELCEGGFNPFGIQPVSADCIEYLDETGNTSTEFTQKIFQAFVAGEVGELQGGPVGVVLGAERREFEFTFDPGSLFGPIAGFNTADPAAGGNSFTDFFGEVLFPLARDQSWARSFELSLGFRHSINKFRDDSPADPDAAFTSKAKGENAYKIEASWEPMADLRARASYQHSVRAPNFGELFAGGGSFPQIFDPCSVSTNFRQTTGTDGRNICLNAGLFGGIPASAVDTFEATPGAQAPLGLVGNTDLKPEKGDTITAGVVFNKWGFTGSVDYYNIKITDAIFGPDVNLLIAACYNYQGNLNPDLDPTSPYCNTIIRNPNIAQLVPAPPLGDEDYNLALQNIGKVKTSGLDFQLGYKLPLDGLIPGADLTMNAFVNYLIDFKVKELPGVTLDYADTVSYFGQGLGSSFPRWKGVFNGALNMRPVTLSTRIRYIDAMKNRASVQFPGETSFTGVPSVWYFDFAAEATVRNVTLRLGVNNAFDKQPPVYAPNVQSGTDPSTYDVIGRRAYVSARLKF